MINLQYKTQFDYLPYQQFNRDKLSNGLSNIHYLMIMSTNNNKEIIIDLC